jgi:hypothetical protein
MYLEKTRRFFVLTTTKPSERIPTIELSRFFKVDCEVSDSSSGDSNIEAKEKLRQELLHHLQTHGFVVLTLPRNSLPGRIILEMQDSVDNDFFPGSDRPSFTATGDRVYCSEKGVPMWPVGYEYSSDDGVREVFRVAAGWPDGVPYPSPNARTKWIRGLAFCRNVCDRALQTALAIPKLKKRPGSSTSTWKNAEYSMQDRQPLPERQGDYSVLYAMHYFNKDNTPYQDDNTQINLKQHVDPSLFVLEPFLAAEPGLQLFSQGQWITCDGPSSPIHQILADDRMGMVLFVGTGFCRHLPEIQPTLHRVITAGRRRTTMIYEQKYEEFFPPPSFD